MNFARGMPVAGGLVPMASDALTKRLLCVATLVPLVRCISAALPGRSLLGLSAFKSCSRGPLRTRTRSFRWAARPGVLKSFRPEETRLEMVGGLERGPSWWIAQALLLLEG